MDSGLKILELIKNSNLTQKVYFRGDPYYLWFVNIPGEPRCNLSLNDNRPLSSYYVLSIEELKEEVYSEEAWIQILRDNKLNNLLDNAGSL